MAEDLEKPIESVAFLELYHKSALKVEKLHQGIRKLTYTYGVIAVFFFVVSGFAFLYSSNEETKLQSQRPNLRAGTLEDIQTIV